MMNAMRCHRAPKRVHISSIRTQFQYSTYLGLVAVLAGHIALRLEILRQQAKSAFNTPSALHLLLQK